MKVKISCMNCSCFFETDVNQSGKDGLSCPKCHKEFAIETDFTKIVSMVQKSGVSKGHNYKILS